jgi:putative hydrolase of the HAD superfamily
MKTILFDLGNVLVPFQLERGYAAFSAISGLDAALIATRLQNSSVYGNYESGRLSTTEFQASISELLQIPVELEPLRQAWNHIFLPEPATSEALLLELKARYRLVLLSNTNELHFDWLRERFPFLSLFDDFCLSYRVGAMKPDPKIFADAVAKAQCAPHECFYTDDIQMYVEAARAFGIDAEQFTGEAQLRLHLQSRGLIA